MRRFTIFSLITIALALLHVLPAKHHLGDMASTFAVADAWKGIGALLAVGLLALPFEQQARVVGFLKRKKWLAAAALALVVVHLVPAADHVPKVLAAPSFGDAWKAIGSLLAIAWFLAPRAAHVAVLRFVTRAQPSRSSGGALASRQRSSRPARSSWRARKTAASPTTAAAAATQTRATAARASRA